MGHRDNGDHHLDMEIGSYHLIPSNVITRARAKAFFECAFGFSSWHRDRHHFDLHSFQLFIFISQSFVRTRPFSLHTGTLSHFHFAVHLHVQRPRPLSSPIDPCFLLLPHLYPYSHSLFLTLCGLNVQISDDLLLSFPSIPLHIASKSYHMISSNRVLLI